MDHGTMASMFTAREVASTHANPDAALTAGIGELAGSLHGRRKEDALGMLAERAEGYPDDRAPVDP